MKIYKINVSDLMKASVVTKSNQVKFLSNVKDVIENSWQKPKTKKVSSLWERRQKLND